VNPARLDRHQLWTNRSAADVLAEFCVSRSQRTLTIIGIDGRSGSGKSVLAESLAGSAADAVVIHTDDLAWHHSFFDWGQLLIGHILKPLRHDRSGVSYQPQAWIDRGRSGSLTIPATAKLVLVEGVGACRRELHPWLDGSVWVHARAEVALQRVVDRDVDTPEFIADWMTHEHAFFAEDRPWDRADVFVAGELGQPSPGGRIFTTPGPSRRTERIEQQ
jgi:energy-coupling factor transporter ATP-binding protein EcfA2